MEEATFWRLIEQTYSEDGDEHAENLKSELVKLDAAEVVAFNNIYETLEDAAYRWDLWAVAYIIGGGCSDDCFQDFRAMMIRRGEAFYRAVMAAPEEAALRYKVRDGDFDAMFSYGIANAYEELTGQPLPQKKQPSPDKPAGDDWREEDLETLYPLLCRKVDEDKDE